MRRVSEGWKTLSEVHRDMTAPKVPGHSWMLRGSGGRGESRPEAVLKSSSAREGFRVA